MEMTVQGQEGDGKIERSYQIIIKCYVTKENRKYPKCPFTVKIIPKNGHVQHCS